MIFDWSYIIFGIFLIGLWEISKKLSYEIYKKLKEKK